MTNLEIIRKHDDAILAEPPEAELPTCSRCLNVYEPAADQPDIEETLNVCGPECAHLAVVRMKEGVSRLEAWIPTAKELCAMTVIDQNLLMAKLRTGFIAIRNGFIVVERKR